MALTETSGLALPLTRKVMDLALEECTRTYSALESSGTLSINLPPVAMTDLTFPEAVVAAVTQVNCKPEKIIFEVTETSVPADLTKAIEILTRLRLKGFALSIDDFGTGHSSLENLQHLSFNELKIDLGFVRAAETDTASRLIVESSIALGNRLGLTVLAEGVENEALWRWLRDAGCEQAQGYFIARPMPLEKVAAWQGEWDARRWALV